MTAFRRRASELDTKFNPEAQKEKASLLRRARQLEEDFDEQYQRELKRTGVDPLRQPGWAKVIADRVDRSMTTVVRVEDRAAARRENEDDSLRRRRAQAREQERRNRHEEIDDEFNLLRAVEEEQGVPNPAVMAAIERERKLAKARADALIAKQEGKGLPSGPGTMRQQQARVVASARGIVAAKHEAGKRAPVLAPMRQRTSAEDDAWLERVEHIAPTEGPQRVYAASKRWHTDTKYRKAQEADARKLYEKTQRRVEVVNEQGKPLFIYPIGAGKFRGLKARKTPKLGALKGAESERLIINAVVDAARGQCPKAIRNLRIVRPLVSDAKTEHLFERAEQLVASKCAKALEEDAATSVEIVREVFDPVSRSAAQAHERLTAAMMRTGIYPLRKKEASKHIFGQRVGAGGPNAYDITADYARNVRAVREAIRRGSISGEDAEALLVLARDYERAIKAANLYVPERASKGRRFTYTRKHPGFPAQKVSEPARDEPGRVRRRYIR